jgi:hypothetical protein
LLGLSTDNTGRVALGFTDGAFFLLDASSLVGASAGEPDAWLVE